MHFLKYLLVINNQTRNFIIKEKCKQVFNGSLFEYNYMSRTTCFYITINSTVFTLSHCETNCSEHFRVSVCNDPTPKRRNLDSGGYITNYGWFWIDCNWEIVMLVEHSKTSSEQSEQAFCRVQHIFCICFWIFFEHK
jgi:hypothetical protein